MPCFWPTQTTNAVLFSCLAGKTCWVWDCCINPQVLRDAISHRTVKSILIQTCLSLVEERDDIVLSRQFVLPKLAARGALEETKVPRAMLENPIAPGTGDSSTGGKPEDAAGSGQDFFSGKESIASILQKQRENESALTDAVIPAIESATGKSVNSAAAVAATEATTASGTNKTTNSVDLSVAAATPKRPLIQEISSSDEPVSHLGYNTLAPNLYQVNGCSEEFAHDASVVYVPQAHALVLTSKSVPSEPFTIPLEAAEVPREIRTAYSKTSGVLRILVTPRS